MIQVCCPFAPRKPSSSPVFQSFSCPEPPSAPVLPCFGLPAPRLPGLKGLLLAFLRSSNHPILCLVHKFAALQPRLIAASASGLGLHSSAASPACRLSPAGSCQGTPLISFPRSCTYPASGMARPGCWICPETGNPAWTRSVFLLLYASPRFSSCPWCAFPPLPTHTQPFPCLCTRLTAHPHPAARVPLFVPAALLPLLTGQWTQYFHR